jgi:outer membrane protein assembly factor BamD (BamD/ComL family)
MLTGRPWPGVKLLFSDGEKVFAEPATGKDGVYQGAAEELQTATDLRVLALSDGHVASNVVGFGESRSAEALADKGYLYTDRPVYRAGQRVAVRGCLRPVKNNAYVVEAGQVCQLDVRDPRDRTLWEQSLTVSPFGTIHTDFRLPPTSPAGEYRVQVSDKQGRSYQGSFRVAEYKLEPVRLRMETPRRVYYRGEEITGTIRAAYHHGAPLANREIKYQLGDEPALTAQTDAQGLVRFKLPTREFAESQILPLKVSVPEWIVQTSFNFHLAVEEYSIHVSTPRDVFVAGEPFFVTIKTTDAAGQATAQKLKLRVLELTGAEGPVGERTVQESAVETTADGTARPLLKLDQGGRFRVRAEGIDRFGNAISGQHDVRLSDRQDHVRLRVLTDRFTFRAGDTAELLVHWRESPALALVTCEAEKVLRHQFVELKPGTNNVPVTMTPDLAPNFEWAVCVMTDRRDKAAVGQASGAPGGWGGASKPSDRAERPAATPQCCGVAVGGLGQGSAGHAPPQAPGGTADKEPRTATGSEPKSAVRFHEASVPLTVENALHVRVSCPGIVHPGQPAAVTVTTTDPQGKPIAAEVSLALIEGRLRERFSALSSMPRPARQQGAADDPFAERPSEPSAQTMFESKLPSLTELFRGHSRHRLVNTSSSLTFGCRPDTHSIPPRVLTEEGRAEITQQNDELLRWSRRPDGPQSAAPDGGGTAGGSSRPAGPAAPSADFDALIELIRKTVAPASWGGGPGATAGEEVGDLGRLVCQTQTNPAPSAGAVAPGRRPGTSDAADRQPDETGHWSPAVVTGADGLAVVQIAVPDRATAWTLFATGITKDTLAGEATAEFVAQKDLFGQLKLPTAFTVGDEAELLAVVHNDAIAKGSLEVTLAIRIGQRTTQVRRTLEVTSRGVHEIPFPVSLRQSDQPAGPKSALPAATEVSFELTVAAGERRDVLRRRVPLLPDGMTVAATTGGVADASTTIWVEPPAGVPLQSPRLSLVISPSVDCSLLDVVFGGGADTPSGAAALGEGPETDHPGMVDGTLPRESPARKGSGVVFGPTPNQPARRKTENDSRPCSAFGSATETATSDLMAAVGLLRLFRTDAERSDPRSRALDACIRGAIGRLVSSQRDDGSWAWDARGDRPDRYVSGRALWALALARQAGYRVPDASHDKALNFVRGQVGGTDNADLDSRAILLQTLAAAGHGDFPLANRLYRERASLSTAALLHLALAFADMDRRTVASELLELVARRNLDDPAASQSERRSLLAWDYSPAELRAFYALALQATNPQDVQLKPLIDWLLAHRTGARWSPDKATGPAALAVCRSLTDARPAGQRYRLAVTVNETPLTPLDLDKTKPTQIVPVPDAALVPGKQRVRFELTGRARYSYQATLAGFVPSAQLRGTTTDWSVERAYEPAPLERDGREIARGFDIVPPNGERFRNPLTQLPVGRRADVELKISRQAAAATPEQELPYLVVSERIPCGTTVMEPSLRGGFDSYAIEPGVITFCVGNRRKPEPIRYALCGDLPGSYRVAPAMVRDAHRPQFFAVATSPAGTTAATAGTGTNRPERGQSLRVLPAGQPSADPYRLTPRELFALGQAAYERRDWKQAETHLAELAARWTVEPNTHKQVIFMLLNAHLELGHAEPVARCIEIIREKWPQDEIAFAKILKIGAAYDRLGEFERSYLIFRATVENVFTMESGAAGFLKSRGEFLRSLSLMERLLREYPPEGYVAAAHYAVAQQVSEKVAHAADDAKLRQAQVRREHLVARASRMLETFLTLYPDDPSADQVAFSAAHALLEQKQFAAAAAACERYAQRYPKSDLLDSFWYIIGYSRFAAGQPEPAREVLRRVVDAKLVDKATGQTKESDNKWLAIFLLAQIEHSLGRTADAITQYRRIEDRIPDAKKSIDYFLRQDIRLPELTTLRPGQPTVVDLGYRNLTACEVRVYRIDLMKFTLLGQDLGGITQVNLSGIRPQRELAVALGDGKDYQDRRHKLPLELKDEGAYLVVCRGGNLYASGLVLVTPLELEVRHDEAAQEVRATVKDAASGRYLHDVQLRVAGSANEEFVSGTTDRRGLFIAQGIVGMPTVIAQAGPGRYAFYRDPSASAGEPAVERTATTRPRTAERTPAREPVPMATPDPALVRAVERAGRSTGVVVSGPGASPEDQQVELLLDKPTTLNVRETPLDKLGELIERQHGIPVRFDRKALEQAGIGMDTSITFNARGMSLRAGLKMMLKAIDLTHQLEHGGVTITTREEADANLSTVVYPVGDLVRVRDSEGKVWADYDSVITTIESSVAPPSWDSVGGPGAIHGWSFRNTDVLVVSQTQEVHREIASALQKLRAINDAGATDGELPVRDRPQVPRTPGPSAPFGGMVGMGFGGGGMGGAPPRTSGPAPAAGARTASGVSAAPVDVLKGLKDANRALQGRKVKELEGMYNKGMGGMGGFGGGGFF